MILSFFIKFTFSAVNSEFDSVISALETLVSFFADNNPNNNQPMINQYPQQEANYHMQNIESSSMDNIFYLLHKGKLIPVRKENGVFIDMNTKNINHPQTFNESKIINHKRTK